MDIKEHKTKHRTITHSQNESTNQQQIKTTEQPPLKGQQPRPLGGLNVHLTAPKSSP